MAKRRSIDNRFPVVKLTGAQYKVLRYLLEKPEHNLVDNYVSITDMAKDIGVSRVAIYNTMSRIRANFGDRIIESSKVRGSGGYRLPGNVREYLRDILNG